MTTPPIIGRKILRFKSLASTQDYAMELARKGEEEGLVVYAEEQTKGRGRLGRNWFALPTKSLTISILLRPHLPLELASYLSLFPALACAQALEKEGIICHLKWPNDIVIEGKKVGGILVEMESKEGKTEWVVVGIGINVNLDREDFTEELRETATSLLLTSGKKLDIDDLLKDILEELNQKYPLCLSEEGRRKLRELFERRDFLKGKILEVRLGEGEVMKGVGEGIDERGFLRLRVGERVEVIPAGDVNVL